MVIFYSPYNVKAHVQIIRNDKEDLFHSACEKWFNQLN